MMDFYEGWDLYQRLMRDGYLPAEFSIENGVDMDLKIEELAREHYNWTSKEPIYGEPLKEYREMLEQQTDSDRIHHIWEIAVDYDGYRTYRALGGLVDEIVACAQVKTKSIAQVLNEIKAFNQYEGAADFMNSYCAMKSVPFSYSFPINEWMNVEKWCENNGFNATFLCFNIGEDGETIAAALKIERKDNKNDII